ncbi:hypothetical protein HHX47_DHR7000719 [Lentinula edodes]|nr:hypothetical protein HHX47_DHR7000719 [Lentinula edodes]
MHKDGISSKRYVDGPGVWVSCVRGKERQTVGELYDLFHSVAADLWPIEDTHLPKNSPQDTETREESEVSIEEQINAEVIAIKRPKSDQKFGEWQGGSVNLLDHKSQQRVVRPILPAINRRLRDKA